MKHYNYKYNIVYKTTNKINGKIYYGAHRTDNLDDDYFGSGKAIKRALNKYGKENFTRETLFFFNNKNDMDDKEREIIAEEGAVADPNSYNMKEGGHGGDCGPEARIKISQRTTEYYQNPDNRVKSSEVMIDYYKNPENRTKHSERQKEFYRNNPEARTQKSEALKEFYQNNPESKIQKSEALKEFYRNNPESKIQKSEALKEFYQNNPEARIAQSERQKGSIRITDGTKNRTIPGNNSIPEGWWRGMAARNKHRGNAHE